MKVIISSKNPVKVESARMGFESYFEGMEILAVDVASEVSNQPMSNEETLLGAKNRVKNARLNTPDAAFWVGIEGGIENDENGLAAFAWIVVTNGEKTGFSKTTTFYLPQKVKSLIEEGHELGDANDIIFEQENSKQKSGAVGLLTKNQLNRTNLYKQAVQLALIPFVNSGLY